MRTVLSKCPCGRRGWRIFKEVDADGARAGSSVTTEYLYDGDDIVLPLDGYGDMTNRYLQGPAVDQSLPDEQVGKEVLRPLADGSGNGDTYISAGRLSRAGKMRLRCDVVGT